MYMYIFMLIVCVHRLVILLSLDSAFQPLHRTGVKVSRSHSGGRKTPRDSDIIGKPLKKSKILSTAGTHKNKKAPKPRTLVVSIERVAVGTLPTPLSQKEDTANQLPIKFPRSKLKGKFASPVPLTGNRSNDGSLLNRMAIENMDTALPS